MADATATSPVWVSQLGVGLAALPAGASRVSVHPAVTANPFGAQSPVPPRLFRTLRTPNGTRQDTNSIIHRQG